MPDFNADDYFARKIAETNAYDAANPINDRVAQLNAANRETEAQLKLLAATQEKQKEVNDASLVGKLGLDANGVAGTAVNLAAHGLAGFSRNVIGQVAALPSDNLASHYDTVLSPDDRLDYNDYVKNQGNVAPEIIQRLNTRGKNGLTPLEAAANADQSRGVAKDIRNVFNIDWIKHGGNRAQFSEELKQDFGTKWDKISESWDTGGIKGIGEATQGVAALIAHAVDTGWNNKTAVAEYAAENLPQLLVGGGTGGAAALAATNVGYAYENYSDGLTAYKEQHAGEMPSEDDRLKMAGLAASLAAVEQVGDVFAVGKLFKGKGLSGELVDSVAKKSLARSVFGTAKDVGESTAIEAATEAYQTYAEELIKQSEATAEQIYESAVIGGLSGGAITGATRIPATAAQVVSDAFKAQSVERPPTAGEQAQQTAYEAAVASGDTTALTEKGNVAYAPEKAVAALFQQAQAEDATPEVREANFQKATEIVSSLEAERQEITGAMNPSTSKEIQEAKADLVKWQAKLDALDPADTETAEIYKEVIQETQAVIDTENAQIDPQAMKQYEANLKAVDARIAESRKVLDSFNAEQVKDIDPDTEIEAIQANTEASPKAAERLINLSMAVPERIDLSKALALANDQLNSLTPEQRDYLRKFSEARTAENAAKSTDRVSQDIFTGSPKGAVNKFIGISQYRKQVMEAVQSGNMKAARKAMLGLETFAEQHQAKADFAEKQIRKGLGSQMVRTEDGQWVQPATRLSDEAIRQNGGLTLQTPKLPVAIRAESNALNATVAELNAVIKTKNAAVQPVTQAQSAKTVATQEAAPTPVAATPVAEVSRPTAGIAPVEAARVEEVTQPTEKTDEKAVESVPEAAPTVAEQAVSEKQDSGVTVQADAEAKAEPKVKNAGQSFVYAQSTKEKPYQERNLIADHTKQDAGPAGSASVRPLVAVKDFIASLVSGETKVSDYVKVDESRSAEQKKAIQMVANKVRQWNDNFVSGLKKTNREDFRFKDPIQFLFTEENGKLDLEQNVKTAMTVAIVTHIYEEAANGATHSPETLNKMLGRDKDHEITDAEWEQFYMRSLPENYWRDAIGSKAVQALGIKPTADADKSLIPLLEASLGAHIEKLMLERGLIVKTSISEAEGNILRDRKVEGSTAGNDGPDQTDKKSTAKQQSYIRLNWQSQKVEGKNYSTWVLPEEAQIIKDAQENTGSVLTNLFGVESNIVNPSLEPIPFTQANPDGTNDGVPSTLEKALSEKQAEKNYLSQDKHFLLEGLDDEIAYEIFGVVSEAPGQIHASRQKAVAAKNDNLRREYARYKAFVAQVLNGSLDTPFYFPYSIWQQQRVGLSANGFNPQMSKMHRYLTHKESWRTTVDVNDAASFDSFKLRVLEGLGVKTDRQANTVSLPMFEQMFDPESKNGKIFNAAIEAIQARNGGADLTPAQQRAIADGVKAGGEKGHTLDVLMGMAAYRSRTSDTFPVIMMAEVDGVNNGPMLSFMLYGAAASVKDMFARLNKGGMYAQGSGFSNYNVWRGSGGKQDLYEGTAGKMIGIARDMARQNKALIPIFQSIFSFSGQLVNEAGQATKDGRNIIKTPINAIHFGSGTTKSVNGMADNFVEGIYKRIEKLAAMKETTSAEITLKEQSRAQFIEDYNILLDAAGIATFTKDTSIDELMSEKAVLNKNETAAIKDVFMQTLGAAAVETLKEEFSDYLTKRDKFNQVSQMTFRLYNAAYKAARAEYIAELVQKGELVATDKGVSRQDLSRQQEKTFEERMSKLRPMVHTAMSRKDKDKSNGLIVAKSGTTLGQSAPYEGRSTFATPIKGSTNIKGDAAMSMTLNAMEKTMESPGVGMSSKTIHSFDSSISHTVQIGREVLNVHDALGTGLPGIIPTANALNEATWNELLNYSPISEMYNTYISLMTNLSDMAQKGEISDEVVQAVAKELQDYVKTENNKKIKRAQERAERSGRPYKEPKNLMNADTLLVELAQEIQMLAYNADTMKFKSMGAMESMDQYAMEGGNYAVTDEDRAEALKRADNVPKNIPAATMKLVERLNEALVSENYEAALLAMEDTDAEMEETVEPLNEKWGTVGKSTEVNDPELIEFFESKPNATVKDVLFKLNDMLKTSTDRVGMAQLEIVRQLAKSINMGMRVNYVTPENVRTQSVLPNGISLGFFNNENGAQVYIQSDGFTHGSVTTDLLIHELTHAAVAQIVADENRSADATRIVNDLAKLQTAAKTYAEANGLKYNVPLTDLQEFITYGMSNLDFQRNVLSKIQFKSATTKNRLVKGMQAFIAQVTGILFSGTTRTQQEVAENGLSVLIANVSGLYREAERIQGKQLPLNLSMAAQVNDYTTADIHNALKSGAVSPEFSIHLGSLLDSIVFKLHGTNGSIHANMLQRQAVTPLDVWQKVMATGQAPMASSIAVAPLATSAEEAFVIDQVEAVMRSALTSGEAQTKLVYKELQDLYAEAKGSIKVESFHPGDWALATPQDKQTAQEKHDFLFKPTPGVNGQSTYLARFAALGLGHQEINGMLSTPTVNDGRKLSDGKSIAEKVQIAFEIVLGWFVSKATHTFQGQPGNEKLQALVEQLVDIEAKRKIAIVKKQSGNTFTQNLEAKAKQGTDAVRSAVIKGTQTNFIKNSKSDLVRALNGVIGVVAMNRVNTFMDLIQVVRDRVFDQRQDVVSDTIQQIKGPREALESLHAATKTLEQERKDIITQKSKMTLAAFKNGATFNKETKAAISAILLRTGMHNLLGRYNVKELEKITTDKNFRAQEIKKIEAMVVGIPANIAGFMIQRANVLGKNRATGQVNDDLLLMNGYSIARLFGTAQVGRITEAQSRTLEPIIDQLVSLYALEYSSNKHQNAIAKVFKDENARKDDNGVEFLLGVHRSLEAEALERNFGGVKTLMIHGFLPEITNPQIDHKVVTRTEGQDLIDQGYAEYAPVPVDPSDPVQEQKFIYVMKGAGLTDYVSGAISTKNMKAKGTAVDFDLSGLTPNQQYQALQKMEQQRAARIAGMFNTLPRPDLSAVNTTFMAPVLNESGQVVDYRYLMREDTKDVLLERDNSFNNLIGSLAGSIFDKESSIEQNRKIVKALYQEYKTEFSKNTKSFVTVSERSTDPEDRQIWALLPQRTKDDIRAIWGRDEIIIRRAEADIIFGYRKKSASDMFRKLDAQRQANKQRALNGQPLLDELDWVEKLFTGVVEHTMMLYARVQLGKTQDQAERWSRRAAMIVTKTERVWQEIIRETKDIIVVKSGVVMLGNIWSNVTLLALNGVSRKDMVQNQLVALKAATAYQNDSAELARLKTAQEIGYSHGNTQEALDRIVILEDSLARNPVKDLIDKGLMPTIVEDVSGDEDIYSYKSKLSEKLEKYQSKLNPTVRNIGRGIYMTHDTKIYQSLSRITQMSDFVARYALYQHLISKNNALGEKEAIQEARDAFINYDLPMHRHLQYMDDMGLMMFTKYFFRIQRVLVKLARDNPLRVMLTVALQHFYDLGPIVLDSSAVAKLGNNPLTTGILQYPKSLDNLGTISAAEGLMKMMK